MTTTFPFCPAKVQSAPSSALVVIAGAFSRREGSMIGTPRPGPEGLSGGACVFAFSPWHAGNSPRPTTANASNTLLTEPPSGPACAMPRAGSKDSRYHRRPPTAHAPALGGNGMKSYRKVLTFNLPERMAFRNITPEVVEAVRRAVCGGALPRQCDAHHRERLYQ